MHASVGRSTQAVGLALGVVFLLALGLRLSDVLDSPVIGAEDPFTHIVITRELVEQGFVAGSKGLNYPLYPPGMHLLAGAFWSLSGLALYDVARFLPPVLGAMGVLCLAVVLYRELGIVAGAAGGLLVATMPEHIFRTTLFFPSVVDLMLIPLLFLTVSRAASGERSSLAPAILLGAALTLAHPWATLLVTPIGLGYLALRIVLPPADSTRDPNSLTVAAICVMLLGLSAYVWWRDDQFISVDEEFGSHLVDVPALLAQRVGIPVPALVGLAGVGVIAAAIVAWIAPRIEKDSAWRVATGVGCGAGASLLAYFVLVVLDGNLPQDVNFWNMLGLPALLLAFAGLFTVCVRRTHAGDWGLATFVVTFPFAAVDVFDSPYWSHRTVAYLAVGVALMGGVALSAGADALAHLGGLLGRGQEARVRAVAGVVALALLTLCVVPVGLGAYTWARYYTPEEYGVITEAASIMDKDPQAVMFVSVWQSNLFLRAVGDMHRVVWATEIWEDDLRLDDLVDQSHTAGRHVYVLVDHHTYKRFDLSEKSGNLLRPYKLEPIWACCEDRAAIYRLHAPNGKA